MVRRRFGLRPGLLRGTGMSNCTCSASRRSNNSLPLIRCIMSLTWSQHSLSRLIKITTSVLLLFSGLSRMSTRSEYSSWSFVWINHAALKSNFFRYDLMNLTSLLGRLSRYELRKWLYCSSICSAFSGGCDPREMDCDRCLSPLVAIVSKRDSSTT